VPQPAPTFEAGQTVPRLRGDLKVTADLSKEGVVTITDSRSGAAHTVRDVELSLARMLNGQRTAQEVVEAAQRIGLPINLESLSRFVGKLRGMGLLDEVQGDPLSMLPGGTWPHREPWPPETRELYQVALKAFRSEELEHAQELLERQMREAPTAEAQQLLAKVQQKIAARAGGAPQPFAEEWSAVEHSWFDAGEHMGDAAQPPQAEAPPEEVAAPKKRSKAPLIVVLLLLIAGGAAAALVPLPATAQVPAALAARASQSVTAPRAGTLASVEVKDGQWVEKGAVLVRYDAAAASTSLSVAKSAVDKLEAQLKKERANPKRAKAKAALEKAQAALTKATAALDKAQAAPKPKKAAVSAATKAKAAAEKAVAAAEKGLAAAGGDAEAKLEADVAAAKKDLEARQAEAAAVDVVAPAAGMVAGLTAKAGAAVTSGGALLRLDDTKVLRAELDVPAKDRGGLKVGQGLSIKVGDKTIASKLTKADEAGVQAEVDNAAGALKAGDKGSATLSLGGKTLLGRL